MDWETSRALLFLRAVNAPTRLTPRASMRVLLAGIEEGRRLEAVLAAVEASAVEVLGLGAEEALDPAGPLTEQGFGSLEAIELRRALWLNTGVEVPVDRILRGPTLWEISEYLLAADPLTPLRAESP